MNHLRGIAAMGALTLICGTAVRAAAKDHLVVAADGSGDFSTVQAAVDAVTAEAGHRVTIEIKPGTYKERIEIPKGKPPISFVGTDAATTVLTFGNSYKTLGPDGKELRTSGSASTYVWSDDFTAENVTFENSAGPVGQALAISINGDRETFRRCRFLGFQDTIYGAHHREYFEDCYIRGAVDYIFGGAAAWFERCELDSVRYGAITAASTPQDQPFGYVFSHCRITGDAKPGSVSLGRPWRPYASVLFMYTEMSAVVQPTGWGNWNNPANEKTARYSEYKNTGPGATPDQRVPWSRQLTDDQAKEITVEKVLGGNDHWNPVSNAATTPSADATTK